MAPVIIPADGATGHEEAEDIYPKDAVLALEHFFFYVLRGTNKFTKVALAFFLLD